MANENFGLGFTVSDVGLWNDPNEGKHGAAGTISAQVVDFHKEGPAGTIFFAPPVIDNKHGPAGVAVGLEFCLAPNVLFGLPYSTLDSSGGFSPSSLSCP